MTTEIAVRESWGGAAERGLQARRERQEIVDRVLIEGQDFGIIPGTDKKTLLKPGAEKITDSLNLYPDYERITCVEDWDKPLFHYAYRCRLRYRGSDDVIATGIGSCNSMESRYRWRMASRRCPKCAKDSIIKGREEYGGGWLCFVKKGGCGEKYDGDDVRITSQETGKVPNDDVYSQVNTIDKMAQKRALVAANLNLGFSDRFTQDMEDISEPADEPAEESPAKVHVPEVVAAPTPTPMAAASDSEGRPLYRGRLLNHSQKDGTGTRGPWKRSSFKGVDNEWYATFDAALASKVLAHKGEHEFVWEPTDRGGRDIIEWRPL